jgi:dTMP kinase
MLNRGAYVTLDGIDACGKTTVVERLRIDTGCKVFREPGGTPFGARVRSLLLDIKSLEEEPSPLAEVLLLSADRAVGASAIRNCINNPVRPRSLMSDRSVLSTLSYQCRGRDTGITFTQVMDITKIAMDGLMPDLSLIIDIAPEICFARLEQSGVMDREGFLEVAEEFNIPVIDGSGTKDEVYEQIHEYCGELLMIGIPRGETDV